MALIVVAVGGLFPRRLGALEVLPQNAREARVTAPGPTSSLQITGMDDYLVWTKTER